MPAFLRSSRALFRFSGPDAQKLLFDVVTGRVLAEEGSAVWWALLSPQGKIQAEGLASYAQGAFWLDVDRGVADAFLKRMRMYKLRAAVEIEDLRESHVVAWSDSEGDLDPRAAGLGYRLILPREEATELSDSGEYPRRRIEAGVAEQGSDFDPDTTFPHDIGMDLLGGVDFKKGCYIGQEVVSRMQHRGTARRRPVVVSGLPDGTALGAPITIGEREAGAVGQVVGGRSVAILRLDRITDPAEARVGGLPVTLSLPQWASYRFGESGAAD